MTLIVNMVTTINNRLSFIAENHCRHFKRAVLTALYLKQNQQCSKGLLALADTNKLSAFFI